MTGVYTLTRWETIEEKVELHTGNNNSLSMHKTQI